MKRYIAILEIDDDKEIIDASVSYVYRSNGTNYSTAESVELKAEDEGQRMKTYEDGLNEAWEVVRRMYNEFAGQKRIELFGYYVTREIVNALTPQEVIKKIKKYEETNVEIKLGDEVESCGAIGVVVESPYDGAYDNEVLVLWANSAVVAYKKQDLKKTGRHFSQIEEIIMQMQESRE